MFIEIIGIVGTLFVLTSFLMRKERTIRLINVVGSVLFVIYGLGIGAIATWLLNAVLVFVHIYFLLKKDDSNDRRTS